MNEENQFDNDPERTLITLEQLSQTIEVMTSVVNRLRKHLSEQLKAQIETQRQERLEKEKTSLESEQNQGSDSIESKQNLGSGQQQKDKDGFVIEIRQQENDPARKNTKILH
ncbi:MAG: hypothetical protein P8N11_03890 [Gammaproteobacteria bacterium]|nr:hypothetical protein [Gammaproteobacteria bacterium]